MGIDLKSSFSDFKLEEMDKSSKRNFLRLPQIPIKQFDIIKGEDVTYNPPDLEVEGGSKFRDKYYNLLHN